MNTEKVPTLCLLLVLLFATPHDALGAGQSCKMTQVRECYSSMLDSVVEELSQQQPDVRLYEDLCKKYGTTSQCKPGVAPCLLSNPEAKDMETLYTTMRQEACGEPTFAILRSLTPTATCTPVPRIVSCVKRQQLQFDNSTQDAKSSCTELEAGLLGCLIAPDVDCPKNRKRATYARKTLKTLMRITGCDAGDDSPSMQLGGEKCWYKQLKRCHERLINDIRAKTTRLFQRNLLPDGNFTAGICRRTRKACHQHSTVKSCPLQQQEAIRLMEEAMNEAQTLLCKNDRALLTNLMLSYKLWDITHFTKCSTPIQISSITDFLYNRPRLHSDCRPLKARILRCLNESYAAASEAVPKPDVDGALRVLAIFLDRMVCIEAHDPLVEDYVTSGPDNTSDGDYRADEPEDNSKEAGGTAMPVMRGKTENGVSAFRNQPKALAGFVVVTMLLARRLVQR